MAMEEDGTRGFKEQDLHRHYQHKRRRKCLVCCGVCFGILLLIVIILIILAFTLFKPKQPRISVDSVQLQAFNLSLNLISPKLTLALTMWVSVKNPNRASFKYSNSTSHILYHGDEVAQALIPAGKISAQGTERFATNVTVEAFRVIGNPNLLPDITRGTIPISTSTVVSGRVNVLNVFKRHATSSSTCNITVSVSTQSVQDLKCTQKTKL